MSSDSKPNRRRQNSAAASKSTPSQITVPIISIEPKSAHVADPGLQPFLNPSFDASDYLNAKLPPLQNSNSPKSAKAVPLAELSTQTQTLLSQLTAHTTRLTTTLTQLTDEILRSGSRLAYEVEILRGETLGLSESLTKSLYDDVVKFVPGGLDKDLAKKMPRIMEANEIQRQSSITIPRTPVREKAPPVVDPPYIQQLRTLTLVRSRLETVIKTFGDAMAWTFPPSEVSVASSFLSLSAPEPGSETSSTEEKGQQISKKLRDEIGELLMNGDPIDGIEAAAKKVEELKQLAILWKGTAEERARMKFVESLAKMVEDRHRDLLREAEEDSHIRQKVEVGIEGSKGQVGFGFINQLQKLRGMSS